jgi:hypothetical protein
MWRGYENGLRLFHDCCIREWLRRGYANNRELYLPPLDQIVMPPWMGREDLHSAYRACLLLKMPEWYSHFGWTEEPAPFSRYPEL